MIKNPLFAHREQLTADAFLAGFTTGFTACQQQFEIGEPWSSLQHDDAADEDFFDENLL